MRSKLLALALAAALAVTAGGVVAADAGSGEQSAAQYPDDYGVEVTDPEDVLSDGDVDRAIEMAWGNETFHSHFETDEYVHFDVWVLGPDEPVHVSAGPSSNASDDRVDATVDLDSGVVKDIEEPITVTASEMKTVELDGYEIEVVDATDEGDDGTAEFEATGNRTDADNDHDRKLTAAGSFTVELDLIEDAVGPDGVALYEMVGIDE
ncbi:hypothetical protein [Halorhabdus rudnickae]|uniref:hypothetical protein n=1 Tax=Halorhabdus rudnickae TaxID=1775544 RepID=UPI001083EF12|nr:hypothetical protein [Halorhabdus rudnickae]